MNYSTAKWLIGILATISIATTFLIFFFDHREVTSPLLEAIYKPIILITGVPVLILAIGHVVAKGRKEEQISSKSFGRFTIVVAALFAFRWMTGYFN